MSFIRLFAFLFGVIFIAVGVMGFIPSFTPDGLLLGYFEVDDIHNVIHLLSGIAAILAAFSLYFSRLYFQIFGIIYGLVTILGFVLGGDLYLIHVNMADNILHLGISIVALFLGFFTRPTDLR